VYNDLLLNSNLTHPLPAVGYMTIEIFLTPNVGTVEQTEQSVT